MLAGAEDVVPYLLERRLIEPSGVVDGGLVVRDVSRRNRNYLVQCEPGPSFILKQGTSDDTTAGLALEGAIYETLDDNTGQRAHSRLTPHSFGFDASNRVLTLELVQDAVDLRRYHGQQGRFPMRVGRELGRALATLHGRLRGDGGWPENVEDRGPAWVLSLHRPPPSALRDASLANLEMLRTVQEFPEFGQRLDELRAAWESRCLVHFDLRWDNVLVVPGQRGLKLIDWEFARIGDPLWDVGTCFAEYLHAWLRSMPEDGVPAEQLPGLARAPLSKMQPALAALWQAYTRGAALKATDATRALPLATSFAAARLLELTYQQLQGESRLTTRAALSLQLALNVLQAPEEAAPALLGIGS